MKHKRIFSFLVIASGLICSGCSIPTMLLKHENQIDCTYQNRGQLKIALFEDKRAAEERDAGGIATNSPSPKIWSGSTSPEMMLFFQKSLIAEAEKTHLYQVNDESKLVLSGYVSSMKIERRTTYWPFLAMGTLLVGLALSDLPDLGPPFGAEKKSPNMTPALIGSIAALIMVLSDHPIYIATVDFHAILMQNGSTIFEKDIKLQKQDENYSHGSEWTWQNTSDNAAEVLDQAVTESIKKLFEEISEEAF